MSDDVKKPPHSTDSESHSAGKTAPDGYALPPHIAPGRIEIGRSYQAPEGEAPRRVNPEAAKVPPPRPAHRGKLRRAAIWTLVVFFSFVAVLQGLALVGVIWLQSESGERFIGAQLAALAAQSGYEVTYDGLEYGFPHSFDIAAMHVSGADGLRIEAENLRLRVNVLPLAARTLSISLFADKVEVTTPPAAESGSDEAAFILPAQVPDIWFRAVRLGVQAENFKVDEFPALTPEAHIGATLGDIVDIKVKTNLYNEMTDDLHLYPRNLAARIRWDVAGQALRIEDGGIKSPAYQVTVEGDIRPGGEEELNLEATAESLDIAALAGREELQGAAQAHATLKGAMAAPSLSMTAMAEMVRLKESGFGALNMQVDVPDVTEIAKGQAVLETAYKDRPARMETGFAVRGNAATITGLEVALPGARLSGDGEVDWGGVSALARGQFTVAASDIAPLAALAGVTAAGAVNADIALNHQEGAQAVDIKLNGRDMAAYGVTVARVDGAASFPDILSAAWPQSVRLNAADIVAAGERLDALDLAIRDLGQDRYDLSVDASAAHLGGLPGVALRGGGRVAGLRTGPASLRDMDMTLRLGADRQAVTVLRITGAAAADGVDVSVAAADVGLMALGRQAGMNWPPSVQDAALTEGKATLKGPLNAPVASFSGRVRAAVLVPAGDAQAGTRTQVVAVEAAGGYEGGAWNMTFDGAGDDIRTFRGTAKTTGDFSLAPFKFDVSAASPLQARLDIAAGVAALSRLMLPPDLRLDGTVDMGADIGGTIGNPDIKGDFTLSDGRLDYVPYEIVLSDLAVEAAYDEGGLTIRRLSARDDGKGRISASGRIGVADGLAPDLALRITDYRLFDGREIDGEVETADLTLTTRGGAYLLGGAVKLGAFDIQIPERFRSSIPELNIVEVQDGERAAPGFAQRLGLDIQVSAPGRIFVRGWGLDAEFGGDVHLGGTAADPEIEGELSALRGRYEELGKRFTLDRAVLRFLGPIPPSPYLDVKATTRAGDVEASIALSGPLNKPEMGFSSVPALPQDEVLSRILFGTEMGRITPFQAIRLKTTFDRLTGKGGGGFDPLAEIRSLTGVDDIRVDTDAEGQNTVGVGKYLTDKVYLELEQGQAEASGGARIQVELTPHIQLESKVGQNSEAGGSVQWRWDY